MQAERDTRQAARGDLRLPAGVRRAASGPLRELSCRTVFGGRWRAAAHAAACAASTSPAARRKARPSTACMGALGRTFGLERPGSRQPGPAKGKSYFLNQLLRDVVFVERGLVRLERAGERAPPPQADVLAGAGRRIGVALSGAAGRLGSATSRNQNYIADEVGGQAARCKQALARHPAARAAAMRRVRADQGAGSPGPRSRPPQPEGFAMDDPPFCG